MSSLSSSNDAISISFMMLTMCFAAVIVHSRCSATAASSASHSQNSCNFSAGSLPANEIGHRYRLELENTLKINCSEWKRCRAQVLSLIKEEKSRYFYYFRKSLIAIDFTNHKCRYWACHHENATCFALQVEGLTKCSKLFSANTNLTIDNC